MNLVYPLGWFGKIVLVFMEINLCAGNVGAEKMAILSRRKMSSKFIITGVQLGMLIALKDEKERQKVADEIIDKQFIGNEEERLKWII